MNEYDTSEKAGSLENTKSIQKSLLPAQPKFPGFDIYGRVNQHYAVGGDFYHFSRVKENKLALAVGDVAGKGIEAAPIANFAHALLHLFSSINPTATVAETMFNLNNYLVSEILPKHYITLIHGELDNTGNFEYCTAGSEHPLLYSKGKLTEIIRQRDKKDTKNLVIGCVPRIRYDVQSLKMQGGDVLFLFTDGMNETIDIKNKAIAHPTLEKFVKRNPIMSAKDMSDNIFEYVNGFKEMDDQTLLTIKML